MLELSQMELIFMQPLLPFSVKKPSLFHIQNIIEVINLFSILFSILVSKHRWERSFQKSWQDMKIAILQIAKTAQK